MENQGKDSQVDMNGKGISRQKNEEGHFRQHDIHTNGPKDTEWSCLGENRNGLNGVLSAWEGVMGDLTVSPLQNRKAVDVFRQRQSLIGLF